MSSESSVSVDVGPVEIHTEARLSEEQLAISYRYPNYQPDRFCISAKVPPPPFYVRNVGRMYVLREKIQPDGLPKFICMVGPCWPMICITLGLIIGVSLAVFATCMSDIPIWLSILACTSLLVTIISFLFTACTDPGVQRRYTENTEGPSWTYSEQAQTFRPPGAVYDLEAQVVINKIDHFCPWTGTIVAEKNMNYFRTFNGSLFITILFVIAVGVVHFSLV